MNGELMDNYFDNYVVQGRDVEEINFPNYWEAKEIGLMLSCSPDYIAKGSRYTCRGCPDKIKDEACIRTGESGSAFYHPDCYYEMVRLLQHKLGQLVPKLNEEVGKKHEET